MKYHNTRINTPDGWFDSKKELRRWEELKLLEKGGLIQDLRRQVRFELIPKIGTFRPTYYVADFVYRQDGQEIVEDAKGMKTKVYQIKVKLMRWRHNIEVLES